MHHKDNAFRLTEAHYLYTGYKFCYKSSPEIPSQYKHRSGMCRDATPITMMSIISLIQNQSNIMSMEMHEDRHQLFYSLHYPYPVHHNR